MDFHYNIVSCHGVLGVNLEQVYSTVQQWCTGYTRKLTHFANSGFRSQVIALWVCLPRYERQAWSILIIRRNSSHQGSLCPVLDCDMLMMIHIFHAYLYVIIGMFLFTLGIFSSTSLNSQTYSLTGVAASSDHGSYYFYLSYYTLWGYSTVSAQFWTKYYTV